MNGKDSTDGGSEPIRKPKPTPIPAPARAPLLASYTVEGYPTGIPRGSVSLFDSEAAGEATDLTGRGDIEAFLSDGVDVVGTLSAEIDQESVDLVPLVENRGVVYAIEHVVMVEDAAESGRDETDGETTVREPGAGLSPSAGDIETLPPAVVISEPRAIKDALEGRIDRERVFDALESRGQSGRDTSLETAFDSVVLVGRAIVAVETEETTTNPDR